MAKKKSSNNSLADNRKAFHEYFIVESMEAGIELVGTEVKSIRKGRVNLKDSFVEIVNGEAFVRNMHVSPYEQGNIFNRDPLRPRKLLLHKAEIIRLSTFITQDGYTMVPLSLYLKNGMVKANVAVVKGKKNYDKRETLKAKEAKRTIDREMRERLK